MKDKIKCNTNMIREMELNPFLGEEAMSALNALKSNNYCSDFYDWATNETELKYFLKENPESE